MFRKMIAVIALALAGSLALAGTASAGGGHYPSAGWSANGDSTVDDSTTVTLKGANTSVETGNLNLNVDAGTEISFTYELHDGAECSGGAPRMFAVVNGTGGNSWDGNPGQCGTDGVVTFVTGQAGLITMAGLVYDNGAGGSVTITNLVIGGKKILFAAPPAASPSPTASASPTVEPSVSPTVEPSVSPTVEPSVSPTVEPSPSVSPSPSPSDSVSPSASPTVEPSPSTSASPDAKPDLKAGQLPQTSGVSALPILAAIGGSAILAGLVILFGTFRRKQTE